MPYPETVKYIKKELKSGFSKERIKKSLLDAGYLPEIVDKLINEATKEMPKQEKKPKISGIEKTILKDIAVGVVLLALLSGFIYFSFLKPETILEEEMLAPEKEVIKNITENDEYYLDWAFQLNNPDLCKEIYNPDKKIFCNAVLSRDLALCKKISRQATKDICNFNIAIKLNDDSICNKIFDQTMKDQCALLIKTKLK